MLVFLSLQEGEEGEVGEVEEVGEEKEVRKSKLSQGPIHLAHTQQFQTMDQPRWNGCTKILLELGPYLARI